MLSKRRMSPFVMGLVALTAACSTSSPATNSTDASGGLAGKTVSIMTQWGPSDPQTPVFNDFVAEFEKDTGVKVDVTVVAGEGSDLTTTYESMVLAGNEPDLVLKNLYNNTVNWMDQGATVPVDDYLTQWGLQNTFQPDALQVWKSSTSGKLRGFPLSGLSWPVWYNMDLLKQVGVTEAPTTTDQLIDVAKKLRAAGIQPFTSGGSDWSGTKLFLQVLQNYMTSDEATKLMSNGGYCATPDAMKGITLFGQLVDSGVFVDNVQGVTHDQQVAAYMAGKAAIMSDGQWSFQTTPAALASATYLGGFPISSDSVQSAPTAYNSPDGPGLHVSPNGAKNLDAVEAFVKAFYQPKWTEALAVQAAVIPVTDTSKLDLSGASPLFQQSQSKTPGRVTFLPMPDDNVKGAVLDQLPTATALAFTPGTSAQTVCTAIDNVYKSAS